jgi:hypothetical protein
MWGRQVMSSPFHIRINKLGFVLLVVHLGVVFWVYKQGFEGSWGGFFLFVLDFPVSLLSFLPSGWNQWLFFGFVGSLWWYAIGVIITTMLKRNAVRRTE